MSSLTNAFSEVGYGEQTTFGTDFDIADRFGADAITDTFKRAFEEWRNDYIYLTELVMVLNFKCWQWYNRNNTLSQIYSDLYYQADDYASTHLKGEELSYYYRTTD